MELQILHMIQGLRNEILDFVMIFFSAIGDGGFVWILISILLLLMPHTRKCGIAMMLSMALTHVLGNMVLKNLVTRLRPCVVDRSIELLIPCPSSYSFPSGHTANGFTAAVTIFCYFRKLGVFALLTAAVIAFSRMYLFVHYPTDIMGGILLGTMDAFFVVWCIRIWHAKQELRRN